MPESPEPSPAVQALRAHFLAAVIAIAVGMLAGAINGWAVGAYADFIIEQNERARELSGRLKVMAWSRTYHFALPLALGGVLAWYLIKRWSYVDGYSVLLPLIIGACVGWLSAQMIGPFAAEDWSAVSSMVTFPAALFVIIPAIKVVQEEL